MRLSQYFAPTLREAPSEAQVISHQLLLRAGYVRQLAAGIFDYLPLGFKTMKKIEAVIREEINAIGGIEIAMPVIHPADLWKESKRWYAIGSEMGRFVDRNERDMVLAMTHEETIADLVRKDIRSHKQLPLLLWHLQTKWRDDPRPRAGLIRVREFTMKDSYSLDKDWEGLDRQYRNHYQAYFNIYNRCGLPTMAIASDTGMMGGQLAHEFMFLTPIGEDTIIYCTSCGYSSNNQVARFRKHALPAEAPLPVEKISTPGVKTIDDLAAFLKIPAAKTAKAVFLTATFVSDEGENQKLVMCIVRGDMDLNETKLTNTIKCKELRPAHEEEIAASGAVAGFASPVGLDPKRILVVVDDLIPQSSNLVAGANQADFHLRNVNYGRDYSAAMVADITSAQAGYECPECGAALLSERGVEVGNIFKLGTKYSDTLGCTFQDENGDSKPVIMGSYGIGVGRLLACVAEMHNDENGLILPISIAPFQVHLAALTGADAALAARAEALYQSLTAVGLDVLFDDREESAGVKFADADLMGMPIRVVISARSLKNGGMEVKLRREKKSEIIPEDGVVAHVQALVRQLQEEIQAKVVTVPYRV